MKKKLGIFRNLGQVKNKSVLSHKIFFREALKKNKANFSKSCFSVIFCCILLSQLSSILWILTANEAS